MAKRSPQPAQAAASPWPHRASAASLIVLTSAVYASAIHPGVDDGDTAELQWAGSLLGICHSPGYALQITVLKLFTSLPIGGTPAWRANVMSAVFGVLGALALYAAIRRITSQVLPSWIAAATLAFSTVYFKHSLLAEVYVFGAAFILLAMYLCARFVESRDPRWLWGAALSLGLVVAERPSEIMIVPAFALGVWLQIRRGGGIDWKRCVAAAGLFVLPFAVAVMLTVQRGDPSRPAAQDEVLRDTISGVDLTGEVTYDYEAGPELIDRIRYSAAFVSGWMWTPRLETQYIPGTLGKYLWLISGLGLWGDRFVPLGHIDPMLNGGASVALPGVLLALAGAVRWRRELGWVLLAAGLIIGNLAFVLPYFSFDNLTFTIPSLIGWCLLVGLGCAAPPGARAIPSRRLAFNVTCLVLPLGLLAVNYRYVDQNTQESRAYLEAREAWARVPWPFDSVILTTYWPAMTLRYMLHVENPRPDVAIIHVALGQHLKAGEYFLQHGRPVFFIRGILSEAEEARLLPSTPLEFSEVDILRFDPSALGS